MGRAVSRWRLHKFKADSEIEGGGITAVKVRKSSRKPRKRPSALRSSRRIESPEDWVPIQIPENLEEMLDAWVNCEGPKIGWCLLCNAPIRSVDDLIADTPTHNCEAGRRFEEEIKVTELAEQYLGAPNLSSQPSKRTKAAQLDTRAPGGTTRR